MSEHHSVQPESPAELAELRVEGLFGRYNHVVTFPHLTEASQQPSLVILFGDNGIGKTTLLQMLDGLLELDFDVFRARPFKRCSLLLTTGQELSVESDGSNMPLRVAFGDKQVLLHPQRSGAFEHDQQVQVEELRAAFREARKFIAFQFIPTIRMPQRPLPPEIRDVYYHYAAGEGEGHAEARLRMKMEGMGPEHRDGTLGSQVRQFVQEAQLNYRRFFRPESDLFERILVAINEPESVTYYPNDLRVTLQRIHHQDQDHLRLGIRPEEWNYGQLRTVLSSDLAPTPLAVLGAYVDGLDARATQRKALADRLLTFESVMAEFLKDKTVHVDDKEGLRIETVDGTILREEQLSSGEFHLLYLMVAALLAQRRGTLIAIDEPEMSMHIKWQHRLVGSLIKCASNARPQLILATHSPDIGGDYREFMVGLDGKS